MKARNPRLIPLTRRHMMALSAASAAAACAPQDAGDAASPPVRPADQPDIEQPDAGLAGCWTPAAPLPFAVQEIYPATHAGRIHLAGGLLGRDGRVVGVSDRHIAYDPATGVSDMLAALPAPRHHPHLVSHAGKLYALGGFGANPGAVNWIMTGDTLVYDEDADAWTPLASASDAHAEVVAASIGERIHIVGGRRNTAAANLGYGDHADSDGHLVFTPSSGSWERAAPALTARNSAAGAVIDGLWHVAGGRSVTGGPTDAHEVYDPSEDRWRTAAPMPQGSGAGGNAAVALGGALYVFGGEVFGQGGDGGKVHPEVWRYDPATDAWTPAAPMPTPRHGLGAVVLETAAYLVGGAIRPSGDGTSDAVERFSLTC